jgi:hypothetical protein
LMKVRTLRMSTDHLPFVRNHSRDRIPNGNFGNARWVRVEERFVHDEYDR